MLKKHDLKKITALGMNPSPEWDFTGIRVKMALEIRPKKSLTIGTIDDQKEE